MNSKRRWPMRVVAAVLVIGALVGVAVAAGQQGTQSDPLVTLSYLTQKATPDILAQVDSKITQREAELKAQLTAVVDGYEKEVTDKLAAMGGSSGSGTSATFKVVTLTQGQKLIGGEGCEFLLRGGNAVCVSDSAPGLIDMTAAGTLANGGALKTNHLYLGTIEGRGVQAKGDVTILVRGAYTIQ